MKKISLMVLLLTASTATFADAVDQIIDSVSPVSLAALAFGGVFFLIGLVLCYVTLSLGTYLLARKYAPKVHPAWSWIPIAHVYPFVAATGQSLWWIAILLVGSMVPEVGGLIALIALIYLYYHLAKRTGRGIGTTLLLIFFSSIMLPYLGLKAHKKSVTPAWILGICTMLALFLGIIGAVAGASKIVIGMEKEYNISEKIEQRISDEIRNNPELQKKFQEAQTTIQTNIEAKGDVEAGQ